MSFHSFLCALLESLTLFSVYYYFLYTPSSRPAGGLDDDREPSVSMVTDDSDKVYRGPAAMFIKRCGRIGQNKNNRTPTQTAVEWLNRASGAHNPRYRYHVHIQPAKRGFGGVGGGGAQFVNVGSYRLQI